MIKKINNKLWGFATYYRIADAYDAFRHIDSFVEGLLVDRMLSRIQGSGQKRKKTIILKRFWIMVDGKPVFALPNDPTTRIMQLTSLGIIRHKPCKTNLNPFLDKGYLHWLKQRRDEQKVTGKYGVVWRRQSGRCAYCNNPMLPDQEVISTEIIMGKGRNIKNLMYIHKKCAYDIFDNADNLWDEHIDLFDFLADYTTDSPWSSSPYLELREYFRLCDKSPITLTFHQIEGIIGDTLPPEAFLYDAFWLENLPGMPSPLWQAEGYPFHTLSADNADYCISDTWSSQGYVIKALYRTEERIVFRRTFKDMAGWEIPKALLERKIPEKHVYELNKIMRNYVKENGL